MPSAHPQPSPRFQRVARSECNRLERDREQARRKAEDLERRHVEAAAHVEELDAQIALLARLAGVTEGDPVPQTGNSPNADQPQPDRGSSAITLRGAAIRRSAVEVLLKSPGAQRPIHYREWLGLLESQGYTVAGRRPDAVFLGQITRSPVVKATTSAGFYEIDFEAPVRLRQQLEELQRRIAHAPSLPEDPAGVAARDAAQQVSFNELRSTQRLLREATEVLPSPQTAGREAA